MSDNTAKEIRTDRFKDDTADIADDSIDLRSIIITLRKYKWPILLSTALATAATALVVSSMTPVYRSTATLMFDTASSGSRFETQMFNLGSSKQDIQTQVEILKSRTLAKRVADKLELQNHWEYNSAVPTPDIYNDVGPLASVKAAIRNVLPNRSDIPEVSQQSEEFQRDQAVRKLMARTSVFPLKQTNLVKVSVEGVDKELSTKIANYIGTGYVALSLDQSDGKNIAQRTKLEEKTEELKTRYDELEQTLLRERQRLGISGDGSNSTPQTISLLTSRMVDAKTRLEDARIEWDAVRQLGGVIGNEVSFGEGNYNYIGTAYQDLPVVDSNSLVQRDKQSVQEAQRVLEELSNRYGAKHPRVVDASSNLATATGNLDRQIANVVSSVQNKYISAQRLVRSIEGDIARQESKAYELTAGAAQISKIAIDRDNVKARYEEALKELSDIDTNDIKKVPLTVSDAAAVPEFPVKPKKTLMVLLGFLLSLFGMSALMFAYESMKETVQGIHDVEKKLGIPVFGIVPVMRSKLFGKKTIPLIPGEFEDKRGAFEEAIRTIRTSSTVSDLESHNQVIMVTSSVPSEGKSTVASNLAHSMSKLENVVLIEADMRRPGLGRALGIRSRGLSELLEGDAYLEDCMRIDAIGKLDIIPAGKIPETHLELLASPEFAELIDLLKSRYDRIIIDLAPVQAVSDAIVVGKYADSAIYVIKADSTPLPVVRRGLDRLQVRRGNFASGSCANFILRWRLLLSGLLRLLRLR